MEQIKCIVCGEEKNLVPAGVSKRTGRKYEAFYSCPNRCKTPYKQPKPTSSPILGNFDVLIEKLDQLQLAVDQIAQDLSRRP